MQDEKSRAQTGQGLLKTSFGNQAPSGQGLLKTGFGSQVAANAVPMIGKDMMGEQGVRAAPGRGMPQVIISIHRRRYSH